MAAYGYALEGNDALPSLTYWSNYLWTGTAGTGEGQAGDWFRELGADKRPLNAHLGFGEDPSDQIPPAHCPADRPGKHAFFAQKSHYEVIGNSYAFNIYLAREFWAGWSPCLRLTEIRRPARLLLMIDYKGWEQIYAVPAPAYGQNQDPFHKQLNRFPILFADGHAKTSLVTPGTTPAAPVCRTDEYSLRD